MSEVCCWSVSPVDPEAFECTLERGHDGPHIAEGNDGRVLGAWAEAQDTRRSK